MFFRRYVTFIIIGCLSSCGVSKQLPAPAWYNDPPKVDTGKLRFDGYYTNVSRPDYPHNKYLAVNPVIFTTGNQLYVSHGAYIDSALFTCAFYKKYVEADDLGKYFIEGNTIHAFVPVVIALAGGSFYRQFKLHFTGTIVNKDFITNWKAVPPFPPKIRKKNNLENLQNTDVFKEHDMKFVQADAVKCLNFLPQ